MNKTSIIPDEASAHALLQLCPDLNNWPRSWRYEERDLVPGQRIVEFFKPFLHDLLAKGLVTKTLRKHRDHLWMLGGEVIRRRQEDAHLCRLPVERVTFTLLDEEGGPLMWPRITEQEQNAFDATCRKLYRFLADTKSPGS